jgi:hypothetical protein
MRFEFGSQSNGIWRRPSLFVLVFILVLAALELFAANEKTPESGKSRRSGVFPRQLVVLSCDP